MALTKQKKHDVVSDVADLLASSKMTVVASYPGTTVKSMQQLRKNARDNGTKVRVVKNRLVIKAIGQNDKLKGVETSSLRPARIRLQQRRRSCPSPGYRAVY